MAIELQRADSTHRLHALKYNNPLVIGTGALILGYVIGTGRWNWLTRGITHVAGSLGTIALNYFVDSFQERNPQIFKNREIFTENSN